MHFPIPSATLNMNSVKSGVMFDLMNNGTSNGDAISHFVSVDGTTILISIITMNITTIRAIPENCNLLMKSIKLVAMICPTFVHSIRLTRIDMKNINTNTYPIFSKLFDRPTLYSFVLLIFPDIFQYTNEQAIIIKMNSNMNPSLNGALSPNSLTMK